MHLVYTYPHEKTFVLDLIKMLQTSPTGTWMPAWVPESTLTLSVLLILCSVVQSAVSTPALTLSLLHSYLQESSNAYHRLVAMMVPVRSLRSSLKFMLQ